MSDPNPRIKVWLCHDHFTRVVRGEVCETCPSKAEHEQAVLIAADLAKLEEEKVQSAVVRELRTISNRQSAIASDVHSLIISVKGDGNGKRGLKTRVMLIEDRMERSEHAQESSKSQWVAVVSAMISLIAVVVTLAQGSG